MEWSRRCPLKIGVELQKSQVRYISLPNFGFSFNLSHIFVSLVYSFYVIILVRISAEEEEELKNWLKNSRGPFSKVCDYMQKTFQLRRQDILSSDMETICSEWPRLFDAEGVVRYFNEVMLNKSWKAYR